MDDPGCGTGLAEPQISLTHPGCPSHLLEIRAAQLHYSCCYCYCSVAVPWVSVAGQSRPPSPLDRDKPQQRQPWGVSEHGAKPWLGNLPLPSLGRFSRSQTTAVPPFLVSCNAIPPSHLSRMFLPVSTPQGVLSLPTPPARFW